ncbi:MAG: hypothetical protein AAGF74_10160 [Pseudomonadota bacterium]
MTGIDLLTAITFGAFAATPVPIACAFDATAEGAQPVKLHIYAHDHIGGAQARFRADMRVDDDLILPASGQEITTTPERDVMIRGRTDDGTFYTLGLRDSGVAALNVMWTDTSPARQATWLGTCTNHEGLIDTWLP